MYSYDFFGKITFPDNTEVPAIPVEFIGIHAHSNKEAEEKLQKMVMLHLNSAERKTSLKGKVEGTLWHRKVVLNL